MKRRSVLRRSVDRRTSKCGKGTVSTRGVRLAARATATVSSVMPYEKFDAWRAAHELALAIYGITEKWPKHELFGLTSQTRRAALSVPANIAEGAGKRGRVEFGRYLDIALGSSSELSYLLRFSKDRGLLSDSDWGSLEARRQRTSILLWRLYRSVRRPGK